MSIVGAPAVGDIEAHVELIHALAAPYVGKGVLVAACYGEDWATGDAIHPIVKQFDIGVVQGMAAWIKSTTALQYRNVYIPLAVFRSDLKRGSKGSEKDVIAVLGLVPDFDDADAANYAQRLPLPADYVLETSAGRFQAFYLFKQPVPIVDQKDFDRIKGVASRLKIFARCDHGTVDLCHVWRCAGTLNHPNKKKVDGGRSSVPQIVNVCKPHAGSRTDFAALEVALTSVRVDDTPHAAKAPGKQAFKVEDAIKFLPQKLVNMIVAPPADDADRSKTLFSAVAWLGRLGYSAELIQEIVEAHPGGIGAKYVGRNDLHKEVARILEKAEAEAVAPTEEVQDDIDYMNATYAVVPVGNKVAIMAETIDSVTNDPMIQLFKAADIKLKYRNKQVFIPGSNGKSRKVCLADHWLDHPQRREFKGLVFEPTGRACEGYYNLFRGFPIKSIKGNCPLYVRHIHDNICRGDERLFTYVMCWMADAVQNPANRPGVALVLRGEEGVGKGVFASEFGKLFGSHFLPVYQGKHLTGHFNAHMEAKLLIFADEAFWAGSKEAEGILKALITEDWFMVERKGFDAVKIRNYVRLIISSNNDWVVPAGMEARRFLVLDVGNAHRCDAAYFKAIADEMDNGGREALMDFLKSLPLNSMNLRDVPQTQALFDNKLHSAGLVEKWWYEVLARGYVNDLTGWPSDIPTKALYGQFIADQGLEHKPHKPSESEFGSKLKKLTQEKIAKARPRGGNNTRYQCYILPPLPECRASFSKVFNFGVKWDETWAQVDMASSHSVAAK